VAVQSANDIVSLNCRSPLTPLPPLPQGEARGPLWGWRGGGSKKNTGFFLPSPILGEGMGVRVFFKVNSPDMICGVAPG
jgi:hypothetical protein